MTAHAKAYLYLHISVLIWGFTAILGKLISLSALPLVWWRVILCVLALWWLVPQAQKRELSRARFLRLLGIGIIIGIHWLCFYGAIKLSNASVAVASMATITFFSALIEPFLLKRPFQWLELVLGIFVLPGILLIAGNLDLTMKQGFAVGIAAAFLAAVFSCLNKLEVDRYPTPPLLISLVELSGAVVVTSIGLVIMQPAIADFKPQGMDWVWLVILAYGCTLLPHYLTLKAMKQVSAFAANLTINLELVYGVIFAVVFFREDKSLSPHFYTGVTIVLLAIFSHPFLKKRFERIL